LKTDKKSHEQDHQEKNTGEKSADGSLMMRNFQHYLIHQLSQKPGQEKESGKNKNSQHQVGKHFYKSDQPGFQLLSYQVKPFFHNGYYLSHTCHCCNKSMPPL
jgi:hypothetical protein